MRPKPKLQTRAADNICAIFFSNIELGSVDPSWPTSDQVKLDIISSDAAKLQTPQ